MVAPEFIQEYETAGKSEGDSLKISIDDIDIYAGSDTSEELLARVIRVFAMFKDATGFTHIYLRCGATDMRCGINSLLGIIEGSMGLNATEEGSIFLFCGKRRDRIKAVIFEKATAGYYVTKYLAVTVAISGQRMKPRQKRLHHSSFDGLWKASISSKKRF